MDRFCLLVELLWGVSVNNRATPSSYDRKMKMKKYFNEEEKNNTHCSFPIFSFLLLFYISCILLASFLGFIVIVRWVEPKVSCTGPTVKSTNWNQVVNPSFSLFGKRRGMIYLKEYFKTKYVCMSIIKIIWWNLIFVCEVITFAFNQTFVRSN